MSSHQKKEEEGDKERKYRDNRSEAFIFTIDLIAIGSFQDSFVQKLVWNADIEGRRMEGRASLDWTQ